MSHKDRIAALLTLEAQEKVANEQYRLFQMIRASLLSAGIDPGEEVEKRDL